MYIANKWVTDDFYFRLQESVFAARYKLCVDSIKRNNQIYMSPEL